MLGPVGSFGLGSDRVWIGVVRYGPSGRYGAVGVGCGLLIRALGTHRFADVWCGRVGRGSGLNWPVGLGPVCCASIRYGSKRYGMDWYGG